MRLLLVRHPRPDIASGLCYGRSDVPADEADLERVRATLPSGLPTYSSPLRRCAQLANALHPAQLRFDARLAEMDFGTWELRSWDAIPRSEVDAWAADLLDYRPGGGESVRDVARRVADFRADLLAQGHAEALVICHAGTIRLLCALHTGHSLDTAALDAARTPHRIGYGEMLALGD